MSMVLREECLVCTSLTPSHLVSPRPPRESTGYALSVSTKGIAAFSGACGSALARETTLRLEVDAAPGEPPSRTPGVLSCAPITEGRSAQRSDQSKKTGYSVPC